MMNDVFKKRLTGVIILVLIGVLVPLLLSRCMHGGGGSGRGSMRVYEIKPNGSAAPAGQSASQSGTQGGNSGASAATAPAGQASGAQHGQGGGGFSTPPVHGAGSSRASSANPPPVQGGSGTSAGGGHQASRNASQGASRSGTAPPRPASGGQHQGGGQPAQPSAQSASTHGSARLENAHISGWVVQVASFSDPDHAADLVRRLRGTFHASYAPGQVKGQTWYRVNVGPFPSKDAASQAAARLGKQGRKGLVRHIP